jgi:hypothetical protein
MFREPIEEPEEDEELGIKTEDDIETMLQNAADFTWPNRLLILALKEIQYLRKELEIYKGLYAEEIVNKAVRGE